MADETVDIRYLLNSDEFARESARIDAAIRGTEHTSSAAVSQLDSDFQRLTKTVGQVGIVTALAAAGREVYTFARDFNSKMTEVVTLSDEVESHLDDYKAKILALTGTVPIMARDAASALYQIVSAGHDGADGMTILEQSAKAAIAGVSDTATAADGITSILNAYQKDAAEAGAVSDMMFTTVRLGKTTFGELAAYIAQVTPTAAAYGVEMDQVLAAIATLTKSGVPTAQAVTRIRQAIVAGSKVLGDGAYSGRTFQEAMDLIAQKADGSESKLRALVPEIEAVNGVLGLTGINAEAAAAHLDEMTRSAGATERAFTQQMADPQRQIDLLKNNLLKAFAEIGDGALQLVGNVASVLNEAFDNGTASALIATVTTLSVAYGTYRTQLLLVAAAKRALENTRYDEESRQLATLLTKEQQRALGITNLSRLTKEQSAAVREKIAAEVQAIRTTAQLAAAEKAAASQSYQAALKRSLASKQAVVNAEAELAAAKASGDAARIEAAQQKLATAQQERHEAAIAKKSAAQTYSVARTKAATAATAANTLQTRVAEATDKAATRSKNLFTVATTRLTRAFKSLKAAFLSNPIGAIITVVTTAAAAMSLFGDDTEEAASGVSALSDALAKHQAEMSREIAKIDELFDALRKAEKGTQEYADAKDAILRGYGSYLNSLGEEVRQLKDVEGAYVAIKNAAIESATARAKASFVEDASNRAAGAMGKALEGLRENVTKAYSDDFLKQFPDQVNSIMAEVTKAMSDTTKSKRDRRIDVGEILENYGLPFRTVYHGLLADKSYFDDYLSALDELSGVKQIADEVFTATTASATSDTAEQAETVSTRVATLRAEIEEAQAELQKLRGADSTASEAQITQAATRLKALQDQLETYTGTTSKQTSETLKKQQELGQAITQAEIDAQAQRIAAMRDGKAKRLAEIDLEYRQTQAKIAKDKASAQSKGATDSQLEAYDSLAAAAEQKRIADRAKIEQEYARQTAEEYRQLSDVFLTEEQRKAKAREKTYQDMRDKAWEDLLAGNIDGMQYVDLSIRIDDAEAKAELDAEVERYRAYLEERTRIEEEFEAEVARLRKSKPHGDAEDEVEQRRRIRDTELQELEDRLGITKDSFTAFVDSLIYKSTDELLTLIETAQSELNKLGKDGDPAKRAEQQKKLDAAQNALKRRQGNNNTKDVTTPSSGTIKKWAELQKVLKGVCGEFDEIGEAIGGTAGEAVKLAGEIATCTLSLIDSIMTAATSSADAVESTSTAATTAIKGVESASVILAVISAALQLATKIAQLFTKDHELSEETIKSYEAYMDATDDLIDKQKELLEVMTGVQALMASEAGVEAIKKQEEATRNLGKAYLASRAKNKHSYGYKTEKKLRGYKDEIEAAGFDWNQLRGSGRMEGLFDLEASEIERFKHELPEVWAKLDEDTRKYLDTLIECEEKMNELGEATAEALTGFTLDDARDELLDFLDDLDATFDDVAGNFQTTMMHAINRVIASGLDGRLKKWYENLSAAMEDGTLSDSEREALRKEYEDIYRDAQDRRKAAYEMAGIDPAVATADGLRGEISEKITEETATKLEGLFRVTYDKVAEIRGMTADQLQTLRDSLADVAEILRYQAAIEENTRRTAEHTQPLAAKLDDVIDELQSIKKGGGIYAK
ncbi:phage tail tape measure protein [uncultured Rikenella sp.]|uniref:phage tail tape measure protein n=2 Tax=uncultured Rikenella sp. TaxID=368003 RepID=UPI002608554B|nr:phage tail tape measure protein [uncultured Rikenella sp.]